MRGHDRGGHATGERVAHGVLPQRGDEPVGEAPRVDDLALQVQQRAARKQKQPGHEQQHHSDRCAPAAHSPLRANTPPAAAAPTSANPHAISQPRIANATPIAPKRAADTPTLCGR